MKSSLTAGLLIFVIGVAAAQTNPQPITWKDIPSWKSIPPASVTLSPDGQWVAYALQPVDGDGEIILQKVRSSDKKTFSIGSTSGLPSMEFSHDSRWFAYKEYPRHSERKTNAKTPGKQLFDKLIVIELSSGKKTEYEKVNAFAFNGEASTHIAMHLARERSGTPKPDDPKGNDLLVAELSSGKNYNIGNVSEFAFNKKGTHLAYTIDATNQAGNGILLFTVANAQTRVISSDKARYQSLNWTEEGDGFAVLKMTKDKKFKQERGAVIGVKNLNAPQVIEYDPQKDSVQFPKNMTISPNRKPMWTEDLTRLLFGIHALEPAKKEDKKEEADTKETDAEKLAKIKTDTTIKSIADLQKAIERLNQKKANGTKGDTTKPDMTIWHWKDPRLQSRQQRTEQQDKNFSYWGMYITASGKFIQLNDGTLKELNPMPRHRFALAQDNSAYEWDNALDGQNYTDVYVIDLQTGSRKKVLEKLYLPSFWNAPRPSPDGTKFLFGKDGHYHVYDILSGSSLNITEKVKTSFINTEDDHNVVKPLTPVLGWSLDSRYILVRDLWDIWQVPINAREQAVNLTQNGKKEKIRYQSRFVLDPDEKGIDLKKPQYFRTYGEWNKKSGIVRLEAGKNGLMPGPRTLLWEDSNVGRLAKAKKAEVYLFSREKFSQPTEFFVADALLKNESQVTQNAPDAAKYRWSSGVRLVDYISDKGDTLQGALFLPAGYEAGKKYPTIVYYYEKLSQTLHNYTSPGFSGTGWNPTVYTSNGYAVFVPDIVYKINDPGMSAVWCVIPGVKAALKTGVIDENRMGIHGHSWGGYQTCFLITQTNMFKAAAAGAPLTNMVSMYDLIYWNTGGGNMAIFEASQGRLTSGPWDNWDAYLRNSPVYHVKNVETPLLMLHNDKDGAVDFTQGVEFYNALRRLKKPVIMVQYKGENHGLSKLENRKDYAVRMMEFFDHHLKGAAAPNWLKDGVEHLKLNEHLTERVLETRQ